MTYYERLKRKRLGDILVDEQMASREAVIAALHQHHNTHTLLSQLLIASGELREYDLAQVMVEQYQLPFLDLSSFSYHRDLIEEFPSGLLHQAAVMPLGRFGGAVSFACQEFPSEEVLGELESFSGAKVFLFAALATELNQALHEHVPLKEGSLPERMQTAKDLAADTEAEEADGTAWKDLFDAANEAIVSSLSKSDSGDDDADDEGDD